MNNKIYLFNEAHNGDVFFTLHITKVLIESNPDINFHVMLSCSHFLYSDLLNKYKNIIIDNYPTVWNIDKSEEITRLHNRIDYGINFGTYNNCIYINLWRVLTYNNPCCISLYNRIDYINNILNEINNKFNIKILFNCNNYKDLIPILPELDITDIIIKLKSYNKKLVFFYNLKFCSDHSELDDNIILNKLIEKYKEDSIIITAKPTIIKHSCLINMEDEFNIKPFIDGKNLIINAMIANNCNYVYIKETGGSLFVLNQINIKNINNVIYHYIKSDNHTMHSYNGITKEYELNCILDIYPNIS